MHEDYSKLYRHAAVKQVESELGAGSPASAATACVIKVIMERSADPNGVRINMPPQSIIAMRFTHAAAS